MQPAPTDTRASGADREKPTPQPRSDFLDFVHSHCLRRTEKTAVRLAGARANPTASAVHDLRVAARRLVYALDCFSTLLDASRTANFRKRVKSILSAARPVRELDVALELVSALDPGLGSSLAGNLRRRRDTAARIMAERLERKGLQNLTHRWLSTVSGPAPEPVKERSELTAKCGKPPTHPSWMPDQSCAANASAVLPVLAEHYFRQGRAVCGENARARELHAFRLAGKRLRYCLELFAEQYGPSLAERLEALRDIQSRLGTLSDYDSTMQLLQSPEAPNNALSQRLLAILSLRQKEATESFLESWKERFDGLEVEQCWRDYLTLSQERMSPIQG